MDKIIARIKQSYKKDVAEGLTSVEIIKKFLNKTVPKESKRIVDSAKIHIRLDSKVTVTAQYDLKLKLAVGNNKKETTKNVQQQYRHHRSYSYP